MRWLLSSGMSSRPWLQPPASEEPLLAKFGLKKLLSSKLGSRTLIWENFTCIIYQTSSHTTWFMLMNLAVIKGLDSGRQDSCHLALPLCKYYSSITTSNIRYYLCMYRMGSSSHIYSAVQLMLLCSRISLHSFSSTVEGGPSLDPCLSWITHHSIALSRLRSYVRMWMWNWSFCCPTHWTSTQLKNFLLNSKASLSVAGASMKKILTKDSIPFLSGALIQWAQKTQRGKCQRPFLPHRVENCRSLRIC